jgi:hypothetical protein
VAAMVSAVRVSSVIDAIVARAAHTKPLNVLMEIASSLENDEEPVCLQPWRHFILLNMQDKTKSHTNYMGYQCLYHFLIWCPKPFTLK